VAILYFGKQISKCLGERAKNFLSQTPSIFCPRAVGFSCPPPLALLAGGLAAVGGGRWAIHFLKFRFFDLWIKFGKIISKVCWRFCWGTKLELFIDF